MIDVVRFYGYEPNKAGYIRCPFHNERTPSLKIYPNRFHCFGCGSDGSVIDFVMKLFQLDPSSACRQINRDFRLGLSLDRPPSLEEQKAAQDRQRVTEIKRLFSEWREQTLNKLDAACRVANLADPANMTDAEAMAVQNQETLLYWSDILLHGELNDQMQVFRERKGVEQLCQAIMNSTRMKSMTA